MSAGVPLLKKSKRVLFIKTTNQYIFTQPPKIMKQLGYVILHTTNTLAVQWKDIGVLDSHISLNLFKIFSRAPAGFEFQFGYSN